MFTIFRSVVVLAPHARRSLASLRIMIAGTALAGLAGCGRQESSIPVYPVSGTVKFQGEPASGAFLVFHPRSPGGNPDETIRPSAQVKTDGSFRLTSFDEGDGAPAGNYAVTIQWNKLVKDGGDVKAGPNVVPAAYSKVETTPLIISVKESENQLEPFEITRSSGKTNAPRRMLGDE
jgi:hypothetical protein